MDTRIKTYCFLFLSFLVASCQPTPNAVILSLSQAADCMETYPDSALSILEHIPDPQALHGRAQADYCLLMTQAMHKNNLELSSDSLISIAVGYYGAHTDNIAMQGKSFFYYGKVMQSIDSVKDAMRYYLKAKSVLGETKEYKMLGLIAEGMGNLNRKQKLLDAAVKEFKSSLQYYSCVSDSFGISYAYRNIGRIFVLEKQVDSAYYYYDKALSIAELKKLDSGSSIYRELGGIYRSLNDYAKAEYYFLASVEYENNSDELYLNYLSLGYLYIQMGKWSEAEEALKICLKKENAVFQRDAYECYYHLKRRQNELNQAVIYKDKSDSLMRITQDANLQKSLAELQKKYQNERLQKENLQMSIQNKNILLMGCVLFFMAVLIIFYFYSKNRNTKKEIQKIQKVIAENEVELKWAQEELEDYRKRKSEKEDHSKEIGELNGKMAVLNSANKKMEAQLNLLGGTALKVDPEVEEYIASFRILLSLKYKKPGENVSKINWKRVYPLFDLLYGGFVTRLREQAVASLTHHDLEICCLLKCGFAHEELSRIFLTASDSVTKAKTRLKGRLGLTGTDDLREFIKNF